MEQTALGIRVETRLGFAEAEARVRETLAAEGFGVLTEIDVAATLAGKLSIDFEPYKILGACNPEYAYRALQAWRSFGVLLPCNVVIEDVYWMLPAGVRELWPVRAPA